MTKKVKHPFEPPELSSRQVKRNIVPLVCRFQEELRAQLNEIKRTRKFPFRYDVNNDMLHLFVASSEGVISSSGHKGVYIDFDPMTHRIVGMTILGFKHKVLHQLEGADDAKEAWRKAGWKLGLFAWIESFAGFFGITLEQLGQKEAKDAIETWVDWYEQNPAKLELMPVAAS